MFNKIRFKKLWFILLVLPLVFTPVYTLGQRYLGLTVGPQLFFPLGITRDAPEVTTIGWEYGSIDKKRSRPFGWSMQRGNVEITFIDWGRIAYWEAWMLAICVVVNRKRLLAKETS